MTNFDEIVDRRNSHSVKWDEMEAIYGVPADTGIPLWVADMDFRAPQCVNDALQAMVDHGVHGYYGDASTFLEAMGGWMKRRHNWNIEPDWALQTHGLVNALGIIIQALSKPGEGVILFSPVYHAFFKIINANKRRIVSSPLRVENNRFHMDLDGLEGMLKGDEKVMFLCSPHNPAGRVWSKEELLEVAAFCERHDIVLVSDEVHHDLIMPGHSHPIMARVAPDITHRLITLVAASKTFNIAGMETGTMLIEDEPLRAKVNAARAAMSVSPNRFGMQMTEAAYLGGDKWLDELMKYLDKSRVMLNEAIAAIPGLSVMDLEATYLGWVDFSGTGMKREEFTRRVNEVGLAPSDGQTFGKEGELCMRFNIACPHKRLADAMDRLKGAFADMQ